MKALNIEKIIPIAKKHGYNLTRKWGWTSVPHRLIDKDGATLIEFKTERVTKEAHLPWKRYIHFEDADADDRKRKLILLAAACVEAITGEKP